MPPRKNRRPRVKKPVKSPKLKKPKKFYSMRQRISVKELSAIVRSGKNKKSLTISKILRDAGYSPSYAASPNKVLKGKGFQTSLNHYLPDETILKVHGEILKASRIDHMVFPIAMKDKEMTGVVESIEGCKVKKIKHGDQANHVWFWSPDNTSRLKAVAEAYKVKNKYKQKEYILTNKLTKEYLDRIIKD